MIHSYKILESRTVENTKVELRDDGIIQFLYADNTEYTMEDTRALERAVEEMTKGVTHMSLRVGGRYTTADIEVMRYLSRGRGALFTLADAFVIHSTPQKILANFYLNINKPLLPAKFFNNVADAEAWLLSLDKEDLARRHKMKIMEFEHT